MTAEPLDLDAIRERVAAAPDGPWTHEPYGEQNQNGDYCGGHVYDADGEYVVTDVTNNGGAFIAHARQDVPALLDAVDCLRTEADEYNLLLGRVAAERDEARAALATRLTCCDPATVTELIDGHHLVEEHQHHTCGAGPGSGAGHEPGCGLVPLVDLRGLPGWDALVATARRDALTEAADEITEHQAVAGMFNADKAAGLERAAVLIRRRAAQEEGR